MASDIGHTSGRASLAWREREPFVRRFEHAWRLGLRPAIDDHLPATEPLRRSVLVELVHTELEFRLKAGEPARVEEYLGCYPELAGDRATVLGLLAAEWDLRRRAEPGLGIDEYLRRFPQHQVSLRVTSMGLAQPGGLVTFRSGDGETDTDPGAGPADDGAVPQVPRRIGKFEVLDAIGRGGFGVVYRAYDAELDRLVALKLPTGGQVSDTVGFLLESQAVGRLKHPNVVAVYEVGQHDGGPYLAMELVEGGSLAQALASGPKVARESARLVETLARAVHEAHCRSILHRDLKPANILLTPDGIPKVADFGLAKRLDKLAEQTGVGTLAGTPSYMAPEQARGRTSQVGPATDVYALGVILYELLTGRPPFRAASELETLHQVLTVEPVPPRRLVPRLPRDLETICLKCLEKDPSRRYARADELADDLRRYDRGEPIRARHVGPLGRAWRWCRRKPEQAVLIGALGVLILASGLAGLAYRRRVERDRNADRVVGLIARLRDADSAQVPAIVRELGEYRSQAVLPLRDLVRQAATPTARRHARLALLPADRSQVEPLLDDLLEARAPEFPVIREALGPYRGPLREGLWRVAGDPEAGSARRLRAAAALASYDPDDPRWADAGAAIVAALVAENPAFLGDWLRAFRPVRLALLKPLGEVFRDPARPVERSTATSILTDYASDQPEALVDLILDADARQFAALWPVLEPHRAVAVPRFETELMRVPAPSWPDAPLDPSWPPPDAALVREVEQNGGVLAERYAFCQTLPLERFSSLADGLKRSGYRPIRLRPYTADGGLRAAAIWGRDGGAWRMALGEPVDEIQRRDEAWRKEGYLILDAACYLTGSEGQASTERAAALWSKPGPGDPDTRLFVSLQGDPGYQAAWGSLRSAGYYPWIDRWTERPEGPRRRIAVLRKLDGPRLAYPVDVDGRSALPDRPLEGYPTDLVLMRRAGPQGSEAYWRLQREQADRAIEARPDDLDARLQRAEAHLAAGSDGAAIADASHVIARDPENVYAYFLRVQAAAHAGDRQAVADDLAAIGRLRAHRRMRAYLDAVVPALLRDDPDPMKRLEAAVAQDPDDAYLLYNAACAYGRAVGAVGGDRERARAYADRAAELLRDAVARGFTDFAHMEASYDLESIREHPDYRALVDRDGTGWNCRLNWRYEVSGRPTPESQELVGLDVAEERRRGRELAGWGYRPVALVVEELGPGEPPVTASVWHRPPVPDEARETLALRQANAAVALVRLGHADAAWRALRQREDPRLRTGLIHRLSTLGADPRAVVGRLDAEPEVSARSAIVLALGGFSAETLPDEVRSPLVPRLIRTYREDPDAGLHSAVDWLLRRWGHSERLASIDRELAGSPPSPEARWRVVAEGHTLVVVTGPVEFVMGSPSAEQSRNEWELPHRRRIPRSFAVATKEVTVEQFLRFWRAAYPGQKHYLETTGLSAYSSGPEAPMIGITWFEAAQYCRWLSEQEGIPEEQMGYPPIAQIRPGMELPDDFLSRTGYRLPTEGEWEYVCRAGTTTSRFFGSSTAMLANYVWNQANSEDRAQPVGRLKPNDLGLFDVHGNAWEWCHDRELLYPRGWSQRVFYDEGGPSQVPGTVPHIMRSGSFDAPRLLTFRSAYRFKMPPTDRTQMVGLRVARTMP